MPNNENILSILTRSSSIDCTCCITGLVGLAITSALNLTGIMNWMVRQMTELEVNMNSVERLVEYLK
jgi:hypothetical protein